MHSNVQDDEFFGTKLSPTKVKLFLYMSGLLIPEVVVMGACGDYIEALEDFLYMEEYDGWTLKHSFFVKMQGFYIDGQMVGSGRDLIKSGANLDKAKCEQLRRDIDDKSKADLLTKSIAVIQIIRFLLEMIARAATSLPLSPLEYFTCAQVVCALLTYIFWFDKPHNVREPLRLTKAVQMVESEEKFGQRRAIHISDSSESIVSAS